MSFTAYSHVPNPNSGLKRVVPQRGQGWQKTLGNPGGVFVSCIVVFSPPTKVTSQMRRRTPPSYWLVVRHESGLMDALTRVIGPERALVVFGFEDEAQMFFMSASLGDGWCVRESSAGELISMLFGPCAYVDGVLLDPPPEVCSSPMPRTIGRRRFVDFLADRQMLWLSARANAGGGGSQAQLALRKVQ